MKTKRLEGRCGIEKVMLSSRPRVCAGVGWGLVFRIWSSMSPLRPGAGASWQAYVLFAPSPCVSLLLRPFSSPPPIGGYVRTWPGWHAGGSRVALGRHWGGTRVAHGWPSGMRRPQARATSSSSSELAWISPEGRVQCVSMAVPDLTGFLFTRSRWQT